MKRLLLPLVVLALMLPGLRFARAAEPPLPPCATPGARARCYTPDQIRHAYGVDAVLGTGETGAGRTITIVDSFGSPTLRADLHVFDQTFGLPDPTLQILSPLGVHAPTDKGWVGETSLDVEWAHAMAPGARIVLLTSPVDETEGLQGLPQFFSLEQYALRHHLGDVISQSWGATEETLMDRKGRAMVARFHALYARATAAGVTIVGGSGDDGAAGRDLTVTHLYPHRTVQWPPDDPLVLGIGGTVLDLSGSQPKETAWPRSGGGVSKLFGEPVYQRSLPAATQRFLRKHRGVPDVSWNAAGESAIPIYVNGRWFSVGGTSAGGPQWAGLIVLADGMAGRDLGDIHSALYALARSSRYSADFRDIISGAIVDPPGSHLAALHAARGWDPTTGLGSPRADGLLADLVHAIGSDQHQ